MQDVNHQLFCLTAAEEIALSGGRQVSSLDVNGLVRALDLEGLEQRHPMSLSGGQKQRVAIASALVSGKKMLVFDEPTSGLDYSHMAEVARLLEKLAEDGAAVLVVTHDMDLVAECCDAAVLLERGSVLWESEIDAAFLAEVSAYLRRDGMSKDRQ